MDTTSWLSLTAICILGAISPGPSLLTVMKSTLQGSRLHGQVTALSHSVGVGLYAFLVAAGLSVVITEAPVVFRWMTLLGALYLAWLGVQSLTYKHSALASPQTDQQPLTLFQASRDGFLIAFLNPKMAVFFMALFSQFVTPESTHTTQFLMALIVTGCDGLWYVLIASVAGHPAVLQLLRKKALWIDRAGGIVLILIALKIVLD